MPKSANRLLAVAVAAVGLTACGEKTPQVPGSQELSTADVQNAALATYVKPGGARLFVLCALHLRVCARQGGEQCETQ